MCSLLGILSPSWHEKMLAWEWTAGDMVLVQSLLISVTLDESVSPFVPLTKRESESILRFLIL